MATEVLVKSGTPITWAHAADYGDVPYADNYEIDLSALANAALRQGVKGDLGAVRAAQYAVRVGIELDVDLTAAGYIEVYWSSSPSATAATSNTGGASGADGAYTDGGAATLSFKEHLQFIGVLTLPAACDANLGFNGIINSGFVPAERYGMPVVRNMSGQALEVAAETMFVSLIPIVDEIQNA